MSRHAKTRFTVSEEKQSEMLLELTNLVLYGKLLKSSEGVAYAKAQQVNILAGSLACFKMRDSCITQAIHGVCHRIFKV